MKLQLKHLAGYLPYGLKGVITALDDDCFIVGASEDYVLTDNFNDELDYSEIKPILHPLSDLIKEINIKNDVFIPVECFEIGEDDNGIEYTSGNIKTIEQLVDISKHNVFHDIHYMPFALVQQLLEWHFDIHGLIEQGLAIDINTLNDKEG